MNGAESHPLFWKKSISENYNIQFSQLVHFQQKKASQKSAGKFSLSFNKLRRCDMVKYLKLTILRNTTSHHTFTP
jgi:outer membrane lipoprotein-sorting protein